MTKLEILQTIREALTIATINSMDFPSIEYKLLPLSEVIRIKVNGQHWEVKVEEIGK